MEPRGELVVSSESVSYLRDQLAVIGSHEVEVGLERRYRASIQAEQVIELLGPVDNIGIQVPVPATDQGQLLSCGELPLAAL